MAKRSGWEGWDEERLNAHAVKNGLPPPAIIGKRGTAIAPPVKLAAPAPARNTLEVRFDGIWGVLADAPLYVKELEGIGGRRYRFDYAFLHPETGKVVLIVELEGLTREGGRHQRTAGFESDAEKYFLAGVVNGWVVVRLTKKLITPENLVLIRNRVRELIK